MMRPAILFVVLFASSTEVIAQDCKASAQAPDAVWTAAPNDNALPSAPLRTMTHLRCLGCKPEVSMLLTAGPASPDMPLRPKVGIEWARAVVDDPAQREGFLQSVLRSELRSSPGCRLQGRVGGAVVIGHLGMVRTDIQAECAQQPTQLSGEFYSGYDGQCLYQVQLVWGPGLVSVSPQGREAIHALLKTVRFGH